MLLGKPGLKKPERAAPEPRPDKPAAADWMFRGEQIEAAMKKYETEQSLSRRAPEFWLVDGTDNDIVFLDEGPLASFNRYYTKFPKKRWWTKPQDENDLVLRTGRTDLRYSPVFVYEIVDLSGYVGKDGVRHNEPRVQYLLLTARDKRERLQYLADKHNHGSLKMVTVHVSVKGQGQGQCWNIDFERIYEGDPLRADPKTPLTRRGVEGLYTYYAPPDEEQQRIILGLTAESQEEVD